MSLILYIPIRGSGSESKKIIIVGLSVFLFLTGAGLTIYGGNYIRANKAINSFSKYIETKKIENLSLTIYYSSPAIFSQFPISVDSLISVYEHQKIFVPGNILIQHIDLLKRIESVTLIPVIKKSDLNARIYYVFETEEEGRLLDVAMWGNYRDSIFVNGFEVNANDIFYDAIIPFLPEDAIRSFFLQE